MTYQCFWAAYNFFLVRFRSSPYMGQGFSRIGETHLLVCFENEDLNADSEA